MLRKLVILITIYFVADYTVAQTKLKLAEQLSDVW